MANMQYDRSKRRVRAAAASVVVAAIGAAAGVAITPVRAATSTWQGLSPGTTADPRTGNWNTAANWSPSGVPSGAESPTTTTELDFNGSTSTAYTATNNISGSSFTLNILKLNSTASVTETITGGTFNFEGANHTIEQDGSGAFLISSNIDNTDANAATTLTLSGSGGGLVTLSGPIAEKSGSKNLSLQKTGSSTFALQGNNSFTGSLDINQGTLSVNSINSSTSTAQPLGNGTSAITLAATNAAAFEYSGSAAATLNRGFTISGSSGGTIRTTGTGALTLGTAGSTSGVSGGGFPLTFDASAANITVSGVISGTGTTVTKSGNNTLSLGSANTYTGGTNLNAGTLNLTGSLSATGTLAIGTAGTLTGAGTANGPATITGNGVVNFSGTLGNTLAASGGTWSGTGSVTGTTTVSGGTFNVTGTMNGAGVVNVNSTGKLAGTGTISKTVSINSGGTLSPGGDGANSNVGKLTTNAHTWAGGSTYVWEIQKADDGVNTAGVNYDTLSVSGTLNVTAANTTGNTMTIKLVSHGPVTNWSSTGTYHWDIATATSVTFNGGSFSADKFVLDTSDFVDDNATSASRTFTVDNDVAGHIRISYVPEPTSAMLCALGGLTLLRRRRRR